MREASLLGGDPDPLPSRPEARYGALRTVSRLLKILATTVAVGTVFSAGVSLAMLTNRESITDLWMAAVHDESQMETISRHLREVGSDNDSIVPTLVWATTSVLGGALLTVLLWAAAECIVVLAEIQNDVRQVAEISRHRTPDA